MSDLDINQSYTRQARQPSFTFSMELLASLTGLRAHNLYGRWGRRNIGTTPLSQVKYNIGRSDMRWSPPSRDYRIAFGDEPESQTDSGTRLPELGARPFANF